MPTELTERMKRAHCFNPSMQDTMNWLIELSRAHDDLVRRVEAIENELGFKDEYDKRADERISAILAEHPLDAIKPAAPPLVDRLAEDLREVLSYEPLSHFEDQRKTLAEYDRIKAGRQDAELSAIIEHGIRCLHADPDGDAEYDRIKAGRQDAELSAIIEHGIRCLHADPDGDIDPARYKELLDSGIAGTQQRAEHFAAELDRTRTAQAATELDADGRRPGKTKLVYDKATRTIVPTSTPPAAPLADKKLNREVFREMVEAPARCECGHRFVDHADDGKCNVCDCPDYTTAAPGTPTLLDHAQAIADVAGPVDFSDVRDEPAAVPEPNELCVCGHRFADHADDGLCNVCKFPNQCFDYKLPAKPAEAGWSGESPLRRGWHWWRLNEDDTPHPENYRGGTYRGQWGPRIKHPDAAATPEPEHEHARLAREVGDYDALK